MGAGRSGGAAPIFFAQEDVKDFFYRLGISSLGEFFALPKIDPLALEVELGWLLDELAGHRDGQIAMYPHLQVLPMGFSWALCHVHLARQCLPNAGLLVDRREAPILGQGEGCCKSGMLIYADNNNHFGQDRIPVNEDHNS